MGDAGSVPGLDFTLLLNVARIGRTMGMTGTGLCFGKGSLIVAWKRVRKAPKVKEGRPDSRHSHNQYLELMVL